MLAFSHIPQQQYKWKKITSVFFLNIIVPEYCLHSQLLSRQAY